MNEWHNDISYYYIFFKNYFPLMFRTVTHKMSENNERYEIKPRTMFKQRSERNIWLVGWGEWSHKPKGFVGSFHPTNSTDISFRSLSCWFMQGIVIWTTQMWKAGSFSSISHRAFCVHVSLQNSILYFENRSQMSKVKVNFNHFLTYQL